MDSFASLRVRGEEQSKNAQSTTSDLHKLQIPSPIAIATFRKLLKRVAGETSHLSNLGSNWQLGDYSLGDEIFKCQGDVRSNGNQDKFIYLICQGKVRVVARDRVTSREVSVQLLASGELLGIDGAFSSVSLSYRVIAATQVTIAQIPLTQWEEYVQEFPALGEYLKNVTQFRQKLLFFKTQTLLSTFSSQQLVDIVADIAPISIPPGTPLQPYLSPYPGRYWLVAGEMTTPTLKVGDSWGYPDPIDPTWSTQTDVIIYHLPLLAWEVLRATASSVIEVILTGKPTEFQVNSPYPTLVNSELEHTSVSPLNPDTEAEIPVILDTYSSAVTSESVWEFLRHQTRAKWQKPWWQQYPLIRQQSSSDCGAACLAMVSQYWGQRLSLNRLRNLTQTTITGASLPAMADAAVKLGYRAFPIRVSLDILEWHCYPWIAHWQGIHYVVVWDIRGENVTLSDPAVGIRKISREEFLGNWTGYALVLDPTPGLAAVAGENSQNVSVDFLWQRFWRYRWLLLQLLIASIFLQVFGLATPLITQVVIDRLLKSPVLNTLNFLALGFLGLGMWRIMMRGVRQYLLDYLSNHMDLSALSGFMRHTLRLPLQFFTSRQAADIITRIEESRKLQLFLTRQALVVGLDVVVTPICLLLMVYYNLRLTLLVLALILPIVILTLFTSNSLQRVSQDIARESARQNAAMVEIVKGIATVKGAAAERWVRWRWEERFANLVTARFRGQKLANTIQVIHSLINHIGNTAILWSGAILVMNNQLSVGKFIAFNMLIHNVINPIFALLELRDRIPEVLVAIERLDDILANPLEERSPPDQDQPSPLRGEIRLHQVCFRYTHDQTRYVLQNISLHILPGQKIGIVGTPGSGKSTLVNLLAGLYQPSEGQIFIDGYEISQISPHQLRKQMGIVSQDCFLFSGTVYENISVFNREVDLEQVIFAAKLAGIHELIANLPLGYQTQIGPRGRMLPTSVRQQIAIARTLIRNPHIFILDQATTALTPETEQQILQNIWHHTHVRTTLIVTNRPTTLQHTDQILILDRGMVVESGTHAELINHNGLYANLSRQCLNF